MMNKRVKSNLKQVIELYDSPDQPAPATELREQEPVAHQYQSKDGVWRDFISQSHYKATVEDGSWPIRALYTFPPAQRTWVNATTWRGLTDEERAVIIEANTTDDHGYDIWCNVIGVALAIEAELKDKNT